MATLRTQDKVPETGGTPQDLEALARSVYDGFNARKLDEVAALLANDCEWLDVASGAVFRGPSGYLEFENAWIAAFPDGRVTVENLVSSGDLVVTEFVGRGTHDGPLKNPSGEAIPATGKKVELRCMELIQFRTKKIVRGRLYYDALSLLRQVGVMT